MSHGENLNLRINKKESFVLPEILSEERPEEYIVRVKETFRDFFIFPFEDKAFILMAEASLKIRREIDTQPRIKFSREKSDKVLEILEENVSRTSNTFPVRDEEGSLQFLGYKRTRGLSMYIRQLVFFPYNEDESKLYVDERCIEGKNIWLLGGGDSVQDLLKDDSVHPASVVNIDPYIGRETLDKNPNGTYRSENIDACDFEGVEKMRTERDIPLADEMWALYSVPVYLETPKQIEGLFKTITQNLAPGGVCRISPLELQGVNFESCKKALIEQVRIIADSANFNAYVVRDTLIIERLPE